MTIVLRHNEEFELNRVEYSGSVTLAELHALARFGATDTIALRHDTLALVQPGADFLTIEFNALDALFAHYRILFSPLKLEILRRSAWICLSDVARPHVDHWLGGRNTREQLSSDVRQFATYQEAGDWLVLGAAALDALEHGEGFRDIVRVHEPFVLPRAATR